jgi:hypothetical protein
VLFQHFEMMQDRLVIQLQIRGEFIGVDWIFLEVPEDLNPIDSAPTSSEEKVNNPPVRWVNASVGQKTRFWE